MLLRHLELANYKNFEKLVIEPSEGLQCIIGPNGSGKTNLLDAIYYSCMARSFFHLSDRNNMRYGSQFFRLISYWSDGDRDHELIIRRSASERVISWNGMESDRSADHLGRLPVVMIVPNDAYTLLAESEERRKLINQTLVQTNPSYFRALAEYHRLLNQKMALLKASRSGTRTDHALLDTYDHSMVQPATLIHEARKNFCSEIAPDLESMGLAISQNAQNCSLSYQSDFGIGQAAERWAEDRSRDLLAGRVHSGIHRDKIEYQFNGQSLKNYGSQGQIKTFVMALRLAQVQYLRKHTLTEPILLLDDLFAKLDEDRVKQLVNLVQKIGISQCFITDTHLDRARNLVMQNPVRGKVFTFEGEKLSTYV
ncbi:MAG: DNA replication and repair protein RecF [Saprospiraceae bacterium]|nr:DNA replication and repair protein RecF [Saprospiraceae bacterium]HMW39994.1 DNA replication and repair protein RecF [Saprospiraceae bacterium]HMX87878.1 DNA replication and repair protein RecF [Saprospiraceae bacterium]HMZ39726.1 DNA replication and repair protein RecF [Saprospiraceae bacterium]HNB30346.1 DNA replication and repair protein RecF [Saprospiraceae bacterium]